VKSARDAVARAGQRTAPARHPAAIRRRRIVLAVAAAATVTVAACWLVLGSGLLAVRSVRFEGQRPVPRGQLLAAAGIRLGMPMIKVDTGQVARRVEQLTLVRSATVSRSWPDTIVVLVRPRTAVLALPAGGGYAAVDDSGVRLAWSARKPRGLPALEPARAAAPPPGQRAALAAGAVLVRLPGRLRQRVVIVRYAAATGITLVLRGGITVTWGAADRPAVKAAELTALLRTQARYLDVSDPATAVAGSQPGS
jgi:cell division protein FtsQ